MTLYVPPVYPGRIQSNLTAAARGGTTVTADATAHTMGAWASLIDPTNFPSYGIEITLFGNGANATDTSMLLDVGFGPTGGGSEQILLPFLNAGACPDVPGAGLGRKVFFPAYIPTGVRVSARCQSIIVSDTIVVDVALYQDPFYPFVAGAVEAYGEVTANSRGTLATSGANAFGSWVSLGTSARHHRLWTMMMDQGGDTTLGNEHILMELGVGPDSANVTTIYGPERIASSSTEFMSTCARLAYAPVISGATVWARIATASAESRGIIAYGID